MLKTFLVAVAFLLLSWPLSAKANLVWDWTGDCQQVNPGPLDLCTHASLHVVTTDDYVPGETLLAPVFGPPGSPPPPFTLLQFLYSDGIVTIDMAPDFNFSGDGILQLPKFPPDGSLQHGGLQLDFAIFGSDAEGNWRFAGEILRPPDCTELINPFCAYDVRGDNGVWRVTEPATLVLLGMGLVGLVLVRRRSQ